MNGYVLHLYSCANITVAKCFKIRQPQKLVPQITFKTLPLSEKISVENINAALINTVRVMFIHIFFVTNFSHLLLVIQNCLKPIPGVPKGTLQDQTTFLLKGTLHDQTAFLPEGTLRDQTHSLPI